ncbi:MAG: hypothetical protein ABEJ91_02320 [Candidatus Nanohaloarchaea archaeon]
MLLPGYSRSRKGFIIKKAVFAIVVFIVGMSAWGVVTSMLSANFLGPSQRSSDVNDMAEFAADLEKKCDAISGTSSGPASVAWQKQLELDKVKRVRIKYPTGKSSLVATFQDGTVKTYQLRGCNYRMEGEIEGVGSYIVNIEKASDSPPTVKAVVSGG